MVLNFREIICVDVQLGLTLSLKSRLLLPSKFATSEAEEGRNQQHDKLEHIHKLRKEYFLNKIGMLLFLFNAAYFEYNKTFFSAQDKVKPL